MTGGPRISPLPPPKRFSFVSLSVPIHLCAFSLAPAIFFGPITLKKTIHARPFPDVLFIRPVQATCHTDSAQGNSPSDLSFSSVFLDYLPPDISVYKDDIFCQLLCYCAPVFFRSCQQVNLAVLPLSPQKEVFGLVHHFFR